MAKRANIRDTRRATETLVAQNRAAHLREQGLIDADAGPREAQRFDQAALKAQRRTAEAQYRASIGPHMSLGFGLIMAVLTVIIWAAGAPPVGFIVGLFAFASLLIWVLSTGIDAYYRRKPGTVQHRLRKVETAAYEYELAVQAELGTSKGEARWLARQAAEKAVEADTQRIRDEQAEAQAEYETDKQRRAAQATEAAAQRRAAAEDRIASRF